MANIISVVSGKGGVGKSCVSYGLGRQLALLGKRVTLMDMDMGLRSLDVLSGAQDKVVYDLADVAEGMCEARQALLRISRGFALLPAAQTREAGCVTREDARKIALALAQTSDFVILDSPAGVGRGFYQAISPAREAIIVTTPDVIALRDAERVKGLLFLEGIDWPRLIINRAEYAHTLPGAPAGISRCLDVMEIPLLGLVPEDPAITRFENDSPSGLAFARVAKRLSGGSAEIVYPRKPGFLRRLLLRSK